MPTQQFVDQRDASNAVNLGTGDVATGGVTLRMRTPSPVVGTHVKLEWEVKPLGARFDGTYLSSQTDFVESDGLALTQLISVLATARITGACARFTVATLSCTFVLAAGSILFIYGKVLQIFVLRPAVITILLCYWISKAVSYYSPRADRPFLFLASVTVNDVDSAYLHGGTVKITVNYRSDQDLLSLPALWNITGVFNGLDGTLTLSGDDTPEHYRDALRAITYYNASLAPNTSPRKLQFIINDGTANSVAEVWQNNCSAGSERCPGARRH